MKRIINFIVLMMAVEVFLTSFLATGIILTVGATGLEITAIISGTHLTIALTCYYTAVALIRRTVKQ